MLELNALPRSSHGLVPRRRIAALPAVAAEQDRGNVDTLSEDPVLHFPRDSRRRPPGEGEL